MFGNNVKKKEIDKIKQLIYSILSKELLKSEFQPNDLVKQFHNRMPVIIPNGLEEEWIASVKSAQDLKALKPLFNTRFSN